MLSMFTVYLDDSGTDPNQPVAAASAYIVPTKQIGRLESEWATLKNKEGFTAIHLSEMLANNKKSEFASWDETKQSRVFQRVRDISKKYGIVQAAVSFTVKKIDYDEVVPEDFRNEIGTHHYTWAIRHIVKFLDNWRLPRTEIPFEYVFDWMDQKGDRRTQIEDVMSQAEFLANDLGRKNQYTNYSFRRRTDVPGLQCVDAISWTCYQRARLLARGTPLQKFADVAWNDYGADREAAGWLQVFTVTRENLQKWIPSEIADGRSIEILRRWKAKHGRT